VNAPAVAIFRPAVSIAAGVTQAQSVVLIYVVQEHGMVTIAAVVLTGFECVAIAIADIQRQPGRQRNFCACIDGVVGEVGRVVVQLFTQTQAHVGDEEHAHIEGFLDFEFDVVAGGVAAAGVFQAHASFHRILQLLRRFDSNCYVGADVLIGEGVPLAARIKRDKGFVVTRNCSA